MIELFIIWLIFVLSLAMVAMMTWRVVRATPVVRQYERSPFFLPNSFFTSLLLFSSFWALLLVVILAQELPEADEQWLIITISLFAPFLSWWRKKRIGDHS